MDEEKKFASRKSKTIEVILTNKSKKMNSEKNESELSSGLHIKNISLSLSSLNFLVEKKGAGRKGKN